MASPPRPPPYAAGLGDTLPVLPMSTGPLDILPSPYPTYVLLTSTVENGVAIVTMPDTNVPTESPMPHGDSLVARCSHCVIVDRCD